MRYWIKAALFAAGLAFSAGMAFAQDAAPSEGPLAAKLTVERVVFDEESKKETLVAAETAAPGDLLQYKGTYTNISEVPLAGLLVKGPIPSNTVFSEGGLSVSAKATLEVLIEGNHGRPCRHIRRSNSRMERRSGLWPARRTIRNFAGRSGRHWSPRKPWSRSIG